MVGFREGLFGELDLSSVDLLFLDELFAKHGLLAHVAKLSTELLLGHLKIWVLFENPSELGHCHLINREQEAKFHKGNLTGIVSVYVLEEFVLIAVGLNINLRVLGVDHRTVVVGGHRVQKVAKGHQDFPGLSVYVIGEHLEYLFRAGKETDLILVVAADTIRP
jgi:hypothetical protein